MDLYACLHFEDSSTEGMENHEQMANVLVVLSMISLEGDGTQHQERSCLQRKVALNIFFLLSSSLATGVFPQPPGSKIFLSLNYLTWFRLMWLAESWLSSRNYLRGSSVIGWRESGGVWPIDYDVWPQSLPYSTSLLWCLHSLLSLRGLIFPLLFSPLQTEQP